MNEIRAVVASIYASGTQGIDLGEIAAATGVREQTVALIVADLQAVGLLSEETERCALTPLAGTGQPVAGPLRDRTHLRLVQ